MSDNQKSNSQSFEVYVTIKDGDQQYYLLKIVKRNYGANKVFNF